MKITPFVILLCSCLQGPLLANPYLDQVQEIEPVPEELERARDQLRKPPTEALPEPLPVPPFHRRPQPAATPATLCRSCHRDPPHREDALRRTFLNMHTRYIACESCHWRPTRPIPEFRMLEELAPDTTLSEPLIAPWIGDGPVVTAADHPLARKMETLWREGSEEERTRLKARLHQPLDREGPGCGRCHGDQQPLLDTTALDFDEERAQALRLNPVARFLERTSVEAGESIPRIHLRELLE